MVCSLIGILLESILRGDMLTCKVRDIYSSSLYFWVIMKKVSTPLAMFTSGYRKENFSFQQLNIDTAQLNSVCIQYEPSC